MKKLLSGLAVSSVAVGFLVLGGGQALAGPGEVIGTYPNRDACQKARSDYVYRAGGEVAIGKTQRVYCASNGGAPSDQGGTYSLYRQFI